MKAMLSGLEIADAVAREREHRRLVNKTFVGPHGDSWDGDGRLNLWERAKLWWLKRQPRIWISDFDPKRVNPNSYNLRLHPDLLVYDVPKIPEGGPGPMTSWSEFAIDMRKDNRTRSYTIPPEGMILKPNRLYLARTVEYTEAHNLVPCIEGRSSIGRLGICVHVTAGFGDVGFCGTWTLEITVVHPVKVYPDVEICQVNYQTISRRHVPYRSTKYQGQQDPLASRLYMELTRTGVDDDVSLGGPPLHEND